MDSPDPVCGNPFPDSDLRHGIWDTATRVAEEEICRLRDLLIRSRSDSFEALIPWYVRLVTGVYDAWAKRGVHVVLDRASIRPFDEWLAYYANEWLKTLKAFIRGTVLTEELLGETRQALIGRREYWKAEARRFVARQEAFQATRPKRTGDWGTKAEEATLAQTATFASRPNDDFVVDRAEIWANWKNKHLKYGDIKALTERAHTNKGDLGKWRRNDPKFPDSSAVSQRIVAALQEP